MGQQIRVILTKLCLPKFDRVEWAKNLSISTEARLLLYAFQKFSIGINFSWYLMLSMKPYEKVETRWIKMKSLWKTWNGLYKLLFKHSNNTIDFLILINWNFSLLSHQRIINWYYEKIWAVELKLIIHFIGLYIKKKRIR